MKDVAHRDEQFEQIAELKASYAAAGNPILSMDTKKKEAIGNFYREGYLYATGEIRTYDHDFTSAADGVVIPRGLYDVERNAGFLYLGTSRDTSEFACDSLRHWWHTHGRFDYPHATSLLLLCDGGGSNSARHYIFKQDLQQLVDDIGIEIRVAHYPPYCSKYNPIEHRFFPHVTRACQGVIFHSVELVRQLMAKTRTHQGLTASVHVIDTIYEAGRKASEEFKANMAIVFHEFLPQWNYTAVPQTASYAFVI